MAAPARVARCRCQSNPHQALHQRIATASCRPLAQSGRRTVPPAQALAPATAAARAHRYIALYGGRPMAASRCAVLGSSLWDRRQHSSSLSAHGKVFPRRLFWYRPPGVAILASSSDLRFCAARSGQQTWGWPKTSEYRRAIPPESSRLQWGTLSWLGSRCPSPPSVAP